ncbi:hypothetical protein K6U06_22810 [Acidiferrimicrobium sp. IK]|uniref:hypothetical protein n=1 Tax=Acidiferrimicrobium sp. IK TaxID=2871700 RepID=UPI0021CB3AB3|nr:hypothetical protein [Acidiferrimicrobium sp. IK]MCU4187211.1 hypothetical protein [Acidiferrimicrobium sp. IK]
MSDLSIPEPAFSPARLLETLEDCGWTVIGQRHDLYKRIQPPAELGDTRSIVIPLNREMSDFEELFSGAVSLLKSSFQELWIRQLSPRLEANLADAFRFRKESEAPSGLIPWVAGEELIGSAKATLLAGAKAHMEPARHFGNRFGQFANRYLDTVLMGQTSPGSYIVTALAPSSRLVPYRATTTASFAYEHIDGASGRDVTNSVVRALIAVKEALAEYREESSLDVFEAGVPDGISYELTSALEKLAAKAISSEIEIEFSTAQSGGSAGRETLAFEFSRQDAPVLNSAALRLAASTERAEEVVTGRVHLLTKKEAGSPGVVGVDDGRRKYRARLGSDEEYHRAVQAHDLDQTVVISGEVSREGNVRWLYGARLLDVGAEQRDESAGTEREVGAMRLFGEEQR